MAVNLGFTQSCGPALTDGTRLAFFFCGVNAQGVKRSGVDSHSNTRRCTMLHYALVFLIVGLIAGALGLAGVAAVAGQIAWILFLIGIVLIVIHLASGHRPPAL